MYDDWGVLTVSTVLREVCAPVLSGSTVRTEEFKRGADGVTADIVADVGSDSERTGVASCNGDGFRGLVSGGNVWAGDVFKGDVVVEDADKLLFEDA